VKHNTDKQFLFLSNDDSVPATAQW